MEITRKKHNKEVYTMSQIIIRVAGLVVDKDKILFVEHTNKGKSHWILPGGGLEFGETFQEGVRREVKEETGIDVEVKKLVYVDQLVTDKNHMIFLTYLCHPTSDRLIVGHDPDHKEQVITNTAYLSLDQVEEADNISPPWMSKKLPKDIREGFPEEVEIDE